MSNLYFANIHLAQGPISYFDPDKVKGITTNLANQRKELLDAMATLQQANRTSLIAASHFRQTVEGTRLSNLLQSVADSQDDGSLPDFMNTLSQWISTLQQIEQDQSDQAFALSFQPQGLPTYPTTHTKPDLSSDQINRRADLLFERFSDDGFLWTSQSTDLSEVEPALKDLSPADAKALIDTYNKKYASKDGRTDLLNEIMAEIDKPAKRYQAIQMLQPDNITNQTYLSSSQGDTPHIIMDPPITFIGTGTEITYKFDPGTRSDGKNPQIRSFFLNDPVAIEAAKKQGIDLPSVAYLSDGATVQAKAIEPGVHTLVYEVRYPGESPRYYTYKQVVRDPSSMAANLIGSDQFPFFTPDVYLGLLQNQRETLKADGLGDSDDKVKQLDAAIQNAQKLLDENATGPALALKAVLVTQQKSQTIPLQLFAKPTKDGWEIVDLTNPARKPPGFIKANLSRMLIRIFCITILYLPVRFVPN